MKTLPPSRTAEQFVIRFPEGVRDRIADLAKANGRSMNAELVDRIQRSLDVTSSNILMSELADIKAMLQQMLEKTRGEPARKHAETAQIKVTTATPAAPAKTRNGKAK